MAEGKAAPEAGSHRSLDPLRQLLPYIIRYRGLTAGTVLFLLIAALAALALPLAVRRMIDHGFSGADGAFIANYFAMLLIVAAILALASALRYYFVVTLSERVVADLRRDVFSHVMRLSPAFFDQAQSGEIVSRLAADATQIKSAIGATASVALRNIIMGAGAVVMMVVTSQRLSLLVLVAIPVIVLPLMAFGRSVRRRARLAQDELAQATAFAGEQISAVRVLQAFTYEKTVISRFAAAVDAAFVAAKASIAARAVLTFVAIFTTFASMVVMLWVGSRDVLTGAMTVGTLGQFLLYAVLAAGAIGALSEVWGELSQAAGAAERMSELLAEEPAITTSSHPIALPSPPQGNVEFRNVHFAYPSRPQQTALRGLSFHVAAGETVAIVGPSGAGKSTIFSLILRYYDTDEGSILIDGIDLRQADPKAVRERIAIVPQDVTVFATTIFENIAFGRPGATREEIEAAAKAALAHDFIMALGQGYDTQVGERGVTLSGGQRQRIAIARAILRDAPILLLDEATSSLDAESETFVQTALERLMAGRSTIVVAHRLATILKADRILVMDEGRIVEEGNHTELVARGGIYARLASLQFDNDPEAFRGAAE
ncbi:ABC transporter transmembrane domain-containing protein [Chelativorans sp. Marseille-P2723]|uniref:ABC transporter transmembrane domain-containing protein n=1 Tax=Chelativorans sp. Marseille-P2723 TaxID=2709133 RepID=UPI001570A4D8|nr:ABC transporter transmembrane domain-containing protein [Chelativorans sp. Marseille-P2723]